MSPNSKNSNQENYVVSVRLPRDLHEAGKKLAEHDCRSFSNFLVKLLSDEIHRSETPFYLEREDARPDHLRVAEDPTDTDTDT